MSGSTTSGLLTVVTLISFFIVMGIVIALLPQLKDATIDVLQNSVSSTPTPN